ncbi:MAG TPA: hypothetical protein VG148_03040 [Pyrinomonadaceae bacterium]|nr:hypothetical protein [Pyrinomonadaceae bacterium]
MKLRFLSACAAAACACALAWGAAAQETKQDEPKVSGGERSAIEKIDKAKGPEAKLQAAAEFLKKYPKSALRPKVAEVVGAEIAAAADPQLKASLARTYLDIFTEPGEGDRMGLLLLDTYITSDNAEEAFRAAGPWLQKNPEDVETQRRLATTALNASIRGNNAFLAQGRQYGEKALELIAADKRPAGVTDAQWAEYKEKRTPALHREVGVIAFRAGDEDAARKHLEQAAALKSRDPVVYLLLGDMAHKEYNLLVREHAAAPPAEKAERMKKAQAGLDRVIELYAQVLAVTEGQAQYDAARAQVKQDLESYYKFRHNGSTEGLQQLIDKYKQQ